MLASVCGGGARLSQVPSVIIIIGEWSGLDVLDLEVGWSQSHRPSRYLH